jgi:hypothetical protein
MRGVTGPDALYDFIGYVVLCAPDDFPVEDYLAADEQMNLERAYAAMESALDTLAEEIVTPQKRTVLLALLHRSLAAYQAGDVVGGAHLLQDFQDLIFQPPK